MGSCEVLDIALNMRRKAVFVRRPRREFEKRKREFVAQICGDSFWPLSVVFRVIEWRHLTLTKERYWMIGWFGFVEFCRVNAMILQCDSSFWTMKHAQDCDEEHKDACVDGELDDGWWGWFDLFHKGQNRTTLGKSANLTWSLFFFLFGLNQIVPKVTVLPFSSLLLRFELGWLVTCHFGASTMCILFDPRWKTIFMKAQWKRYRCYNSWFSIPT